MKVTIIGAGLTGLTIAYLLKKQGIKATLLEARDRIGGRIHTVYPDHKTSVELGATWLGRKHLHLRRLLQELQLEIHQQELGRTAFYEYLSTSPPQLVQLPPNQDPSFRITGGSSLLIQKLANTLEADQIVLSQTVQHIEQVGDHCQIQTQTDQYTADKVINTLPPNLLVSHITYTPALPRELTTLAQQTHTWMGESIKVAFTFDTAFWKVPTSSSTVMSNVGPVGELYDHSNAEGTAFALKGFMNGSFHTMTKAERKQLIIHQLKKYYGNSIEQHTDYLECVWRQEPYTFTPYKEAIYPHQNNGHALFREEYMNGRLLIAGSETASNYPGYMDGAIQSAYTASKKILTQLP